LWDKPLAEQKEERKERAENKRRKKKAEKLGLLMVLYQTLGKQL
jgi:hypothetical protein